MRLIFSSPDLFAVTQLKHLLESTGIICSIRNEISSGLSPEIPIGESTPELWIQDDHQFAEAKQIKADWQQAVVITGSAWTCSVSGEKLEPQFSSCWKCGAPKS